MRAISFTACDGTYVRITIPLRLALLAMSAAVVLPTMVSSQSRSYPLEADLPPEEQARFSQLAVIEGLEFGNGVIELELAGAPAPGAGEGARGFVGIAFRLQKDLTTYDAFSSNGALMSAFVSRHHLG